jgi:tetratricopeptide (TPR) repeat protein
MVLLRLTLFFAASSIAGSLDHALTLARQHRFPEAAAEVASAPVPTDPRELVSYHRLKAAIASGLGDAKSADTEMNAALTIAPDDPSLQVAAAIAGLQARLHMPARNSAIARLTRLDLPVPLRLAMNLQAGQILADAKQDADAAPFLERAAELAPTRPDVAFNTALAYFNAGAWDKAAQFAARAKAGQDSASIESLMGDIAEKRNDPLTAVHAYQAAVEQQPAEERYRITLALELLRHQTFPAAVTVLQQAAQLFPASSKIQILLGLGYYLVDRAGDASAALIKAVHLSPQDHTAAHYLAEITFLDTATPESAAVALICQNPDEEAYCGAIQLRIAKENGNLIGLNEITVRLQQAAKRNPADALPRCQLGKAFEMQSQWEQARGEMEICVTRQPGSTENHYRLARVYRKLGLKEKAAEQTRLQQQAALQESEASTRRAEAVQKFLFEPR